MKKQTQIQLVHAHHLNLFGTLSLSLAHNAQMVYNGILMRESVHKDLLTVKIIKFMIIKRKNVLQNRNKRLEHQHFALQISHTIIVMINLVHDAHQICHILTKKTRNAKIHLFHKIILKRHYKILKELLVSAIQDMSTVEQSICVFLRKHQQLTLNLLQIKLQNKKNRNHNSLMRKLGILPALQKNQFGI